MKIHYPEQIQTIRRGLTTTERGAIALTRHVRFPNGKIVPGWTNLSEEDRHISHFSLAFRHRRPGEPTEVEKQIQLAAASRDQTPEDIRTILSQGHTVIF